MFRGVILMRCLVASATLVLLLAAYGCGNDGDLSVRPAPEATPVATATPGGGS